MFNGMILFSDNPGDINMAIANHFVVIAMVDDPQKYRPYGIVTLGNLLPPYEAIAAEIDGNKPLSEQIYAQYLNSPNVVNTIGSLLAALVGDKNILLYLPRDESMSFDFIQVFANHMQNMFGIIIGSTAKPSELENNPIKIANIANILYGFDYIPFSMYCEIMPEGCCPSELVCGKMMHSFCYNFKSMQACMEYCMNYIRNEKVQNLYVKKNPEQQPCPVFRVGNGQG